MIDQEVRLAREGKNTAVICSVRSGWVVLANRQYLSGYCILLPDPVVPSLNALSLEDRAVYLSDMAKVGDALLEVTDAFRINYAIMGNSDPVLHAHIVPRYLSEPVEIRQNLPWLYDPLFMEATQFDLNRDRSLMLLLAEAITKKG